MQVYLEKVPLPNDRSFVVREFDLPCFDAPLHFHPEYELTLILDGEGQRFVGDNIEDFAAGDLVLVGPNLPHYWHNNPSPNNPVKARSIVIQFNDQFLNEELLKKWELDEIRTFFSKALQGLTFYGEVTPKAAEMMKTLIKQKGLARIITFLSILNLLSATEDYRLLASPGFSTRKISPENHRRINDVYKYVLSNFKNEMVLTDVAGLVNMNPSAFCHYFKKCTRKNFSEFVNEIRVGHACRLLIESDRNISEIAFESGFNNLSNFNRRFKKMKSASPREFREMFRKADK